MQRVYNYGSFLQSYALKRILEDMGHQVCFVDIEYSDSISLPKSKNTILKRIGKIRYIDRYILKRIMFSRKNRELKELFLKVQKEYLNITEKKSTSDKCEAVVIGSDEIFNCEENSKWGVNGQRFGNIPGVPLVFSYAASCGYTKISDVSKKNEKIIRDALQNLKGISVRDKNTEEFVKYFSSRSPEINLDPVLMYDFKNELMRGMSEGIPHEPYMLVYAYHNRINDSNEIAAIKSYAKKNGLKTIAIGGSLPWCDEFKVISPFQVLAYFYSAKCIVTDTFHGTVIAAKYNKPLAVIVRNSNSNKLEDLLQRLNIQECRVNDIMELGEILDKNSNYEKCNDLLKKEREHTLTYLKKMLYNDKSEN